MPGKTEKSSRRSTTSKSASKSGSTAKSKSASSTRAGSRSTGRSRKKSTAGDEIGPTDAAADAAARATLQTSDKLYYRIGEVSRLTGVKAHVLRYWETEFRWMAPPKSRSKQRLYRKRDIEFVWLLKRLLWDERYTIAGARQRIQELGVEGALALLDDAGSGREVDAASGIDAGGQLTSNPSTSSSSDSGSSSTGLPSAEWVSFRAALGEMESELIALKGMLQDGA